MRRRAGRDPRIGHVIRRLAAVPRDAFHLSLMLALTFSTGVIDAVGYLGLDRVFTGNMTGNVVILGMAIVGADDLPVLGPVLALAGFLAGAALGGRVLKSAGPGWTRATTMLFGIVAAVILSIAAVMACRRSTRPDLRPVLAMRKRRISGSLVSTTL